MSRQIDYSEPLSSEDKSYLENFTGVAYSEPVSDVTGEEIVLKADSTMAEQMAQVPNTGTVNSIAESRIETGPEADVNEDEDEVDSESFYGAYTVPNLKAEINSRNEDPDREEADKITPASQRKPDLIAALVADDEAHPDDDAADGS